MRWLYHLRHAGPPPVERYAPESLSTEGFVHASYRDEVLESARIHFAGAADLEVLAIDPRRLDVPVHAAATPRGEMPHVHGSIPVDAIRRVLPFRDFEVERAALPDAVVGTPSSAEASGR
jgi:uncharacterized protein (DUF952 family)